MASNYIRSFWPLVALWVCTASGRPSQYQHADASAPVPVAAATSTRLVNIPTARPSNAFVVPADFVSWGIEEAFLPDFANAFSENMANSLAQRMDEKPVIRVGGTSGDLITINPAQQDPVAVAAGDATDFGSTFTLGPSFFDTFSRFQSSRFSFQAPINPSGTVNTTNVLAYVEAAYKAVGKDRIAAIALGNEPGFYETTAKDYVDDAMEAQDAIVKALNLSDDAIFEVLDLASEQSAHGGGWTVQDAFEAGLSSDKRVKVVAEHFYMTDSADKNLETPFTLQATLLNHTALTSRFTTYLTTLSYLRTLQPSTPFIISEAGDFVAPDQDWQYSFGETLWSVNFQLYAMSIGISRVTMVQRPYAKRALWVPIVDETKGITQMVKAPWYAQPFVADFVGRYVKAERGVVNIPLEEEFLSAYAIFEGSSLARIAIVNMRSWAPSSGTDRKAVSVSLKGLGAAKTATVSRLHADTGVDAGGFDVDGRNITYAGQQWSYSIDQGNGHGDVATATITVTDGAADVKVPDSEAVLITF